MTNGTNLSHDFAYVARGGRYQEPKAKVIVCVAALAVGASAGLWMCYAPLPTDPSVSVAQIAPAAPLPVSARPNPTALRAASMQVAKLDPVKPDLARPDLAPRETAAGLLDPGFMATSEPVAFAQNTALRASFEPLRRNTPVAVELVPMPMAPPPADDPQVAQADVGQPGVGQTDLAKAEVAKADVAKPAPAPMQVASAEVIESDVDDAPLVPAPPGVSKLVDNLLPLPPSRPAMLPAAETVLPRPLTKPAMPRQATQAIAAAAAPAGQPSFFDKLFNRQQQPNTVLAYAAPDDGGLRVGRPIGGYDQWTAVYDISSHTVTLPDGTRLEAHSGLGAALDNPSSVTQHMRGATPPNIYDLTQREALFHGVRALRLTPIGGTTYGRAGLLAHTFMLGPRGDSNGCVVFRDYKSFLRAYDNGQIRRLAVVARS